MKRLYSFLLTVIMVIMNFMCTYASDNSLLHTGGISVDQDVYQVNDKGKRVPIDHGKFMFGQEMSYVVDIKNKLNACYVRIHAEVLLDDESIPNTYLTGIDDTWIRKGNYYYRTVPLMKKEKVNFCSGIRLPVSLDGEKLDIITKVEAIQEYLFTPDFDADEPFCGIPIEDVSVSEDVRVPDKGEQSIKFDDSLGAIVDNKDFLKELGGVMPGQQVSDKFTVQNGSKRVLRLKMVSKDNQTTSTTPTKYSIMLQINKDNKKIFDGYLYDEVFKTGLVLGTIDDNESAVFEFIIKVPVALTNEEAMKASLVNWEFDGELINKPVESDKPSESETEPEQLSESESESDSGSTDKPTKPTDSTTEGEQPSIDTGARPTSPVIIESTVTDEVDDTTKDELNKPDTGGNKPNTGGSKPSGGGSGGGRKFSDEAINNIMYESPDPTLKVGIDGEWVLINQEKQQWRFKFSNGAYAANGWLYVRNPYFNNLDEYSWYHFDDRYMSFGWIKGTGDIWYYGHEISDGDLGTLVKGWHHDKEDGRSYYLDLYTGIMKSGWTVIDGKWYYFAKTTDTFKQNWFWNTSVGRWFYDMLGNRPYGSMYREEMTPDGFLVNSDGVWGLLNIK